MIRALIVDDEPPARDRLKRLLAEMAGVAVVGEADGASDALALVHTERPDVLFLDIEMPEMRGTTIAASLPEPRPFVVFATAYERYALEAFGYDATDYLLKPVSRARLEGTLDRIRQKLARRGELERDLVAASALQADMWPGTLPEIPGFDCAAASLPARGVGGDFYDAFALSSGTWGLLLGDVSGKGVAAALVATAVQARVQTAARHARLGPVALAETLNTDIFASTQGRRYATLIYGTLDASSRRLRVVNAGHPAALLFPPRSSSPEPLPSSGAALGLMEGAHFTTFDVALTPGSLFVAFSDGVIEALDAEDHEFGSDRVEQMVAASRERPAAAICTVLLDEVRHHRGTRQQQDDVTVLVVRSVSRLQAGDRP